MTAHYETITRHACKELRQDLKGALSTFAEERGLEVEPGNASYDESSATFKFTLRIAGHDPLQEDFVRYAHLFGLDAKDYGREFQQLGNTYKLVGIKPKNHKYPIIAERNGKRYKFPADAVTMSLRMAEKNSP